MAGTFFFGNSRFWEKYPGHIFIESRKKEMQKYVFEKIQFCPDPNSHFWPSIKLFHIYGKIDLEKLITTIPI